MTLNTRILRRFKYHTEDLGCRYCLYCKKTAKCNPHGCGNDVCRFEDIRADAIANGRIKRERGWFRRCQG